MVKFKVCDVFKPLPDPPPQFDRIYCGAACPPTMLFYLFRLLKPNGIAVVRKFRCNFVTVARHQLALNLLSTQETETFSWNH